MGVRTTANSPQCFGKSSSRLVNNVRVLPSGVDDAIANLLNRPPPRPSFGFALVGGALPMSTRMWINRKIDGGKGKTEGTHWFSPDQRGVMRVGKYDGAGPLYEGAGPPKAKALRLSISWVSVPEEYPWRHLWRDRVFRTKFPRNQCSQICRACVSVRLHSSGPGGSSV